MSTNYNSFSSNGGHSAKSPGASSGGYKEHEQTRLLNKAFIKAMKARGYKVTDTTSDARNKATVLMEQVNAVNAVGGGSKHLAISFHLNAGGGTGSEALHWNDDTKGIAANLSSAIAKTLGIKDRGPKQRKDLFFLRRTDVPALILEVCFIDNPSDMKKLEAKRQLVAEAIADVLIGRSPGSKDSSTKPTASSTAAAASSTSSTGAAIDTNSLVDYLKSTGQESSFAARAELAVKYGIIKSKTEYAGTYAQNVGLLAAMRKGADK